MWRRPQIRISIRDERAALTALALVTLISAGVLAAVLTLGDQRQFQVLAPSRADGAEVPGTIRSVTFTFSAEPERGAVEAALRVEPQVAATARWRSRTLELVFGESLDPGPYEVTLEPGRLGAAGERMKEPFTVHFIVREPGVVLVVTDGGGQALVEVRGEVVRELYRAERVRDYAISPDASQVAVVPAVTVAGGAQTGGLVLVETVTGQARVVVDDPAIDVGSATWAADSSALLVVRRDRLPSGDQGVPRIWLTRVSGEFVSLIDPGGEPTTSASWSPDAQRVAYTSPATSEVVVLNLSSREELVVGHPRADRVAWSPDSRIVAFESVPGEAASQGPPPQPIRVVSVDGAIDRFFGPAGEVRLRPRFLDAATLMSIRRIAGADPRGTELLFESVEDGTQLRSILLAPPNDSVLDWDLDPAGRQILYAVRSGAQTVVLTMDIESGDRTVVPIAGEQPRWLP